MTIEQLSRFLLVAEECSFTKAADKLFISHSAVSKAIMTLEHDLGTQLMVRNNRSVTLTPAGELLRERGAHLLALFDDLQEKVCDLGRVAGGKLSIYVPYLYATDILPIYQLMKERHPAVDLDVRSCEPLEIGAAIVNRHVDLGITFSFAIPQDEEDICVLNLAEDRFFALVSKHHEFAGLDSVDTRRVLEQPLVCPPSTANDASFPRLSAITRSFRSGDFQADSLEELVFQVALGRGVAILPGVAVQGIYASPECQLVELTDQRETFYLSMLWNRTRLSPALNCFIALVREYLDRCVAEGAI